MHAATYGRRVSPGTVARVKPGEIKTSPLRDALNAGGERREKALIKIRDALVKHDWNATHAADELGVTRMTLFRWLKRPKKDANHDPDLVAIGDEGRRQRGPQKHPGRPARKEK